MKSIIQSELNEFIGRTDVPVEEIHTAVMKEQSNQLRLKILSKIWESDQFNRLYFECCREIVELLCGNELAMQRELACLFNCQAMLEILCLSMLILGMGCLSMS